jgi:hypothetical protein
MATEHHAVGMDEGPFRNPWPALLAGLAANIVALLSEQLLRYELLPVVMLGLLATAAAIAIRPASTQLGLAALSGLAAAAALSSQWDSARLMILVFSAVAAVAAILMLLPRTVRQIIVSLVILFHFGGICTAALTVAPSPWIALYVWTYVYRPYLEFMYLNNAYHFYAPEPGPPTMMWFYVKYEDGTGQWRKIPQRQDYPLAVEYQRRLSLTESINQLLPTNSVPPEIKERRLEAHARGIAVHPGLVETLQYRVPNAYSKRMLESYTRYIALTTPHPDNKAMKVTGVRVYRVIHDILLPKDLVGGTDPTKLTTYRPYYQGEYDSDGRLKDPNDPCLYWLIPIIDRPAGQSSKNVWFRPGVGRSRSTGEEQEERILDFLTKHAEGTTSEDLRQ